MASREDLSCITWSHLKQSYGEPKPSSGTGRNDTVLPEAELAKQISIQNNWAYDFQIDTFQYKNFLSL